MENDSTRADQASTKSPGDTALPPGITLVRTLRHDDSSVARIAWSPDGRLLAVPLLDTTIRLWEVETGQTVKTLTGHTDVAFVVAFDASGQTLASGGVDENVLLWSVASGTVIRKLGRHTDGAFAVVFDPKTGHLMSGGNDANIKIWDTTTGELLGKFEHHSGSVNALAFDSSLRRLASGSLDRNVCVWDVDQRNLLYTLSGHQSANLSVAVDPKTHLLASGNQDATIRLWDMRTGTLVSVLEGHTNMVQCVAFSSDSSLLASKSSDSTLRLWDPSTGRCLAIMPVPTFAKDWAPGLAFHPTRPLLAAVGSESKYDEYDGVVHLYAYDLDVLFERPAAPAPLAYVTARIVLLGDSGVGKTGLGWRLAHGEFREHASTHGQQIWPLEHLNRVREDGAHCEAILWDLAGQPDYRLTHALFLDDADLALVLVDPAATENPLRAAEFWLKQLRGDGGSPRPVIMVAARADRGGAWLTRDELRTFCEAHKIDAFHVTSASTNEGVPELLESMKRLVPWEQKPATMTNVTFKRIRDRVLALKEAGRDKVIYTQAELHEHLEAADPALHMDPDELLTAIGHLATHGHVTRVMSNGEVRVLLVPELLNNIAASFVLEARKNPHGLGALEEKGLLAGTYRFPELERVSAAEREILTSAVTSLFLARNICFRETDPLTFATYLIFPGLINLARPEIPDVRQLDAGPSYTLSGAVENVYASLVVLLGYTNQLTRRNQWRHHAQYVVGGEHLCGFRIENERPGELDLMIYFGAGVDTWVRQLFEGLFEGFLRRQRVAVKRYDPVKCRRDHLIDRDLIRARTAAGFLFCVECGDRIELGHAAAGAALSREIEDVVEDQRQVAEARTRFERAAFKMKSHAERHHTAPSCFISYSWGNPVQEQWVAQLADDLHKSGIAVILDQWENIIGTSVTRFVERAASSDRVIVIGTPEYQRKYDNKEPMGGFVVAAEGNVIGLRLIDSEEKRKTVLPVLLEGSNLSSFPPLLQGSVYADFRDSRNYFPRVMELVLSLYGIPPRDPFSIELREATRMPTGLRVAI